MLSDPAVEAAVLETARGGVIRRGLGYDWADVAVVTNVREDHLGQDGLETLGDLVHVKALVAERVREGGALVVNADDEGALRVLERPSVRTDDKRLVYFSLHPENPVVLRHLESGGSAFFLRYGWVVEATGARETELVRARDLPATFGGAADFQVENALAAVAACRAHGVHSAAVAAALRSFGNGTHNPGRLSPYRLGEGYVVLDYGHNPDALEAVGRFLRRWQPDRPTIGVVKAPGDRSDALIRQSGRAAARAFSHLVLGEDRDLRGRAPGEALALLREGVAEAARDVPVELISDELEALPLVMDRVLSGAVAVVFYEHLGPLLALLDEAGAETASPSEPRVAGARGATSARVAGDGLPASHTAVGVTTTRTTTPAASPPTTPR